MANNHEKLQQRRFAPYRYPKRIGKGGTWNRNMKNGTLEVDTLTTLVIIAEKIIGFVIKVNSSVRTAWSNNFHSNYNAYRSNLSNRIRRNRKIINLQI